MTRHDLHRRIAESRQQLPARAITATQLAQQFYYVQSVGNAFRIYVSKTGRYEGRVCLDLNLPNGNWYKTYREAEAALVASMEGE